MNSELNDFGMVLFISIICHGVLVALGLGFIALMLKERK